MKHPLLTVCCGLGIAAVACLAAFVPWAPADPPADSSAASAARVLIAYDTLRGHTEQMARAVEEGARRVPGVVVVRKKVQDVTKEDLVSADGIILGCPTYFANIPGRMKTILDTWNWKLKVDFTDKVGGAFATGGGQMGGKEHTVVSLLLFMINNRMIVAGPSTRTKRARTNGANWEAGPWTGPSRPGAEPGRIG